MSRDCVACCLRHRLVGVNDYAPGYFGNRAAPLAPDMLVVLTLGFVARLAVPQVHAPDGPRVVQIRQPATYRRKIRGNTLPVERRQHVVGGPIVARTG